MHIALIPQKAIRLTEEKKTRTEVNYRACRYLVGLYCVVAKIQEAHTKPKWTSFMARDNIATFLRGLMECAG